jgi:predicted esterase
MLFLATISCASVAIAAPGLSPGEFSEFRIELPNELRSIAGRGKLSPVTHALVTIAAPANIDMARDWPVLVVSATSDPEFNSSRRLLLAYAPEAVAAGWIVVAVDPEQNITVEQDDVPMRLALSTAALAVLAKQWPGASNAPLAFGGFSGGAKYSGWLAAAFASQGRRVVGVYFAGINQETLVAAATQFNVLNAAFKRVPVFVQAGKADRISTPADHQDVVTDLKRAGFRNIRVELTEGAHEVDPLPLRAALDWFREFASVPATAK